jgi:hypothetical protein
MRGGQRLNDLLGREEQAWGPWAGACCGGGGERKRQNSFAQEHGITFLSFSFFFSLLSLKHS